MSRKRESITLSLTANQKAELEKLALQFGQTWGEKPNISALLKAITEGELQIYWNDEIPKPEIKKKSAESAIRLIQQGLEQLIKAL